MVEPLFKDSLKVHFAGMEDMPKAACMNAVGVQYYLFTCYHFVLARMKGSKSRKQYYIPRQLEEFGKHVIMDSGLFTLMFGAAKGKKDEAFIMKWMTELVGFVKESGFSGTCVEVDCQKVLSPEAAWRFRYRLREMLPNNRIINVFHLEDGLDGLDRLIDFSDYIALSVPEFRIHKSGTYKKDIGILTRYIKSKKPNIDIHLLGCTDKNMLADNRFCTSADSTSWSAIIRWPKVPLMLRGKRINKHVSQLNEKELVDRYRDMIMNIAKKFNLNTSHKSMINHAKICFAGDMFLHEYDYLLGHQR